MATEWKSGDLVKLKSGGPLMTIQSKNANASSYFNCVWFDSDEKPNKESFHADTLEEAVNENVSIDVKII